MAIIAWRLPTDVTHAAASRRPLHFGDLVEWRVLVVGVTLFLYSFSYGGITSFVAVYAEQVGVTPRALYFTVLSPDDREHAAVHRPLCRSRRPRAHHRAVPGDDRARRRRC